MAPLPETAHVGNLRLLDEPLMALFCSNRCPGDLILKTYDLARAIRDAGVPVIGGFQTLMEREPAPAAARQATRRHLPGARHRQHAHSTRLAPRSRRRPAAGAVALPGRSPTPDDGDRRQRNDLVTSLASRVFIAHAAPGSKTEAFAASLPQPASRC